MTGTQESATSKDEPTDSVRALAEAYAWIEYVEEHTDGRVNGLNDAKTAICVAQDSLFDAEVDRARRELTDGNESESPEEF